MAHDTWDSTVPVLQSRQVQFGLKTLKRISSYPKGGNLTSRHINPWLAILWACMFTYRWGLCLLGGQGQRRPKTSSKLRTVARFTDEQYTTINQLSCVLLISEFCYYVNATMSLYSIIKLRTTVASYSWRIRRRVWLRTAQDTSTIERYGNLLL